MLGLFCVAENANRSEAWEVSGYRNLIAPLQVPLGARERERESRLGDVTETHKTGHNDTVR